MSNKTLLNIKEIIQKDMAISTDDGEIVYRKIVGELEKGNEITIDFKGIDIVITAFLNVAFGKLYGNNQYDSEFLNNHIVLQNVAPEDINLFKKVVERAKDYFKNNKNIDNSADSVLDND
jgi:hypothetical protein